MSLGPASDECLLANSLHTVLLSFVALQHRARQTEQDVPFLA
jgi:hypothetical protein